MAEPLGCVDSCFRRGHARAGALSTERQASGRHVESMLVCGAGPAGLMFVQYLRLVLGYEGLLLVSEPNADKRKLWRFNSALITKSIPAIVTRWRRCMNTPAVRESIT